MKKKVKAAATPAAVAVPAPKVAAKRAPRATKPAVAPAIPASASRTSLPEVPAAMSKAAAEEKAPTIKGRKSYPVAKTSTASLCGSAAAIQQARSVLLSARGIGEALDALTRLEAQARGQLSDAITGELKARRVKTAGMNISTESKPDGVHIVLTKQ